MLFISLLLAVTTGVAQDTMAPAAAQRVVTPKRWRAMTLAPITAPVEALESGLQVLAAQGPMIAVQAPMIALSVEQLQAAAFALEELPSIEAWNQQDQSDSLYRAARRALNNSQYSRAAELFRDLRDRYPRSPNVGNAYYWEAFALYRTGADDALRNARAALRIQAERFPKATTRRDAEVLMRRIQGTLARRGDADAAAAISEDVESIAPTTPAVPATPATPATPVTPTTPRTPRAGRGPRPPRYVSVSCDDEDDLRMEALNAMLQMDADRAVPILKTVLARRDSGSTCLRRKAVFLVSQKRSSETARILLDAARSDPDQEVREQAVFWLSQVPGDETVAALDSILQGSDDVDVQDKAIFALSQHRSARAGGILRAYAERRDAPPDLREKAIFWLGQNRSPENAQFLKDLYKRLDNQDLKEKVIFSLSQMGGVDNYRWLMDIALDQNEDIELRKKALFWAGQGRSVDVADLVRLYDSMKDREMREQLIFVYSQRREAAALDKLFSIGKNDPDRELRKKAIFWIGQSRDPRAAQFLQELINQ